MSVIPPLIIQYMYVCIYESKNPLQKGMGLTIVYIDKNPRGLKSAPIFFTNPSFVFFFLKKKKPPLQASCTT